jgi:hypothetical protein
MMKPFNLERATTGDSVVTRGGQLVRILCFDRPSTDYPIVFLAGARILTSTLAGAETHDSESPDDLFMAPVKKEGWVGIFENGAGKHIPNTFVYGSKDACERWGTQYRGGAFVAAAKIEWEE